MRAISAVSACALLAIVSGCVQAQVASLRAKCDFSQDQRFASLRGRVPLSPNEVDDPPTLRQLNDVSKPTAEQREAILQLDEANSMCRKEALKIVGNNAGPDILGLFQEVSLANVNQAKLLANGQISFGQYRNNVYQTLAQARQVLGQYDRAQQAANAASRQAALAQLSATMQSLQAFNRQPTTTTCNRLGTSISCSSY